MTTTVTPQQQIESLRQQLLEAFVAKDKAIADKEQAEERIKAIRNVLAGIPIGQALGKPEPAPATEAAQSEP